MLHIHWRTVARLASSRELKYLVRDYFALPRWQALMPALLANGYGQADLVLCLLRLRDAHRTLRVLIEDQITQLVGHPICIGPSCLLNYRAGPVRIQRSRDDRRITYVTSENPRQQNTEAHMRWCEYRVGRTIGQLQVRGVTKRDIKVAIRRGWIAVEEYT